MYACVVLESFESGVDEDSGGSEASVSWFPGLFGSAETTVLLTISLTTSQTSMKKSRRYALLKLCTPLCLSVEHIF